MAVWLCASALCTGAVAQPAPNAPVPEDGGEAPSAGAAPDGAPSEKPNADDDDLVERAIALRKQRNESAARELLRKAYEEDKSPRVAGHLGLAERALGLAREAEVHLLEALAVTEDPWVVENHELLKDALRYAERQLAWTRIVVRPEGVRAKVTVAGEEVDASQRVRVKAGSVVIEATAPGYASSRVSTEIPPEKELLVTLDLRELPPLKPPVKRTRVATEDDAGPPAAAYWALGGGALALAVGGYFGVRALDEKQTADDLCPTTRCASEEGVSADDHARRFALYSDIGLGVGIVALGVATYLFLTGSPENTGGALRLQLAGRGGSAALHF